jgi:hypothetical protein
MTAYKDIEKCKMYQKLWAREKAIKKKAMISEPIIVESVVEIAEPIVEITEPIVEIVEITEPIVEIVEPIVEIIMASYFNCEECKFKMKRTEYNDCFYPHRIRSKCFIILD